MKTNSKHTPGTLVLVTGNNTEFIDIEADSRICSIDLVREDISVEESKANAARIVKCWNCHDDLLEALEKSKRIILDMGRYIRDLDIDNIAIEYWTQDTGYVSIPEYEEVEAAIQKAKQ